MSKTIIDISTSVDGFVTGPNDGPGNGLGDNGGVLHDWCGKDMSDADLEVLQEPAMTLGSCVLGRRTFDIAEEGWGEEPPFGPARVFVLTNRPHDTLKRGLTTFVFVTEGFESALEQARAAAGDKDVLLMGADISQQGLRAGLVDEMQLHIAHALLGSGRSLFADIGDSQIKLERIRVIPTPAATHVTYRVC